MDTCAVSPSGDYWLFGYLPVEARVSLWASLVLQPSSPGNRVHVLAFQLGTAL